MMLSLLVPAAQAPPSLAPAADVTGWPQPAAVALRWDVAHGRAALEPTTVHVVTDGKHFYVRFDAVQNAPIIRDTTWQRSHHRREQRQRRHLVEQRRRGVGRSLADRSGRVRRRERAKLRPQALPLGRRHCAPLTS